MESVTDAAYLRFPHLHGELICFVSEDDLWLAPLTAPGAGPGRAWRLTADRTRLGPPRFSPDGTEIAFTSWRSLDPEVHLIPVEGGAARQLTYWGGPDARVCSWSPDGTILAVSSHGQPFAHYAWAYELAAGRLAGPPAALGAGLGPGGRRPGRTAPHARAVRYPAARAGRLEALPRRRDRTALAGRHPAAARTGRTPGPPDAGRRPGGVPLRPRGRRQPLLLPPGRHRPAAAHRSRGLLRPRRGDRRAAGDLPAARATCGWPRT